MPSLFGFLQQQSYFGGPPAAGKQVRVYRDGLDDIPNQPQNPFVVIVRDVRILPEYTTYGARRQGNKVARVTYRCSFFAPAVSGVWPSAESFKAKVYEIISLAVPALPAAAAVTEDDGGLAFLQGEYLQVDPPNFSDTQKHKARWARVDFSVLCDWPF